MSNLTIAAIKEMMDRLPPAPPDQELHYHPSGKLFPKFRIFEEANRGTGLMEGRYMIPMIEAPWLPKDKLALITYEMMGRCRVVKETVLVDLV